MFLLRFVLIIVLLSSGMQACTTSTPKKVEPNSQKIFEEVLANPPRPAEIRIIGGKIDGLFNGIVKIDQDYVEQISKINWGQVYDYKSLNQKSKLPSLRKVNQSAKQFSINAFENRRKLYQDLFSELEALSAKSLFAKAMLVEIKKTYDEPETGFLAFEEGMRQSTVDKHDLIDEKLSMLNESPAKYEIQKEGQLKILSSGIADEKINNWVTAYQDNLIKHNQSTARQRKLAEFFIKNQKNIVNRFKELGKQ